MRNRFKRGSDRTPRQVTAGSTARRTSVASIVGALAIVGGAAGIAAANPGVSNASTTNSTAAATDTPATATTARTNEVVTIAASGLPRSGAPDVIVCDVEHAIPFDEADFEDILFEELPAEDLAEIEKIFAHEHEEGEHGVIIVEHGVGSGPGDWDVHDFTPSHEDLAEMREVNDALVAALDAAGIDYTIEADGPMSFPVWDHDDSAANDAVDAVFEGLFGDELKIFSGELPEGCSAELGLDGIAVATILDSGGS